MFSGSHEEVVPLKEFVSAKTNQLKSMCDIQNVQLFGHFMDNISELGIL